MMDREILPPTYERKAKRIPVPEWALKTETEAEKAIPNPERPDFCGPISETVAPSKWLESAINGLTAMITGNEKRYIKSVDNEVIAAVCIARELKTDAALQALWCSDPAWKSVIKKKPRIGVTDNVLEEVFRFFWRVKQDDQDGYELRFRAVTAFYDVELSPEEIVHRIRSNGGYRVTSKSTRKAEKLADDPCETTVTDPSKTTELVQELSKLKNFLVSFDDCFELALSSDAKWGDWHVKADFSQDPPRLLVDIISVED